MASVPAHRQAVGSRSGGKIVRSRQARSRNTPYERPRPSNSGPGQSPNWISRFIFSPTRTIASGAGKLLTSVFVSESSSSSSESDSEDDVGDVVGDESHIYQETEGVKKNGTSEIVHLFRKDIAPEKKNSKYLIEQLLMKETFSRAERDKLFEIIESRVVECETSEIEAEGRLTEISNRAVDTDNGRTAVCSTAIVEAKKWLNEKRLGSSSKLNMDREPCTLNSMMSPTVGDWRKIDHVTDEEMGSPVDVAKTYMRARPPWASPSMNSFEFNSPSPLGLQLFKEESSYSINGNSLSSKMKRDSPVSGSWNIEEEIRRVRSKATEEMLRNLPSVKLDWSSSVSEYKNNLNSIRADNLKTHNEDKIHNAAKLMDKSSNLTTNNIFTPRLSVSRIAQNVSENGTCLLNTTNVILQQEKDLKTNPTSDEEVANSGLDDRVCSTGNEVGALANGCPPASSLAGEPSVVPNHANATAGEQNSSGHELEAATQGVPVEEPCQLLSEASIEIPNIHENDTGKVLLDGNNTGKSNKVSSEKNDTGNVNTVEQVKPPSLSSGLGKTSGTSNPRRGRRRN